MKFFDLHKQSGQAIIYVILLGASVLGAALVANQNILVDILRTKRLEEANIAYYQAEGAMEEALLELKEKGTVTTGEVNLSFPGVKSKAAKSLEYPKIPVPAILSQDLLPETKGYLQQDMSLNIPIPDQVKGKDGYQARIEVGTENIQVNDPEPLNVRLEVRSFNSDSSVSLLGFWGKAILNDTTSDFNNYPLPKASQTLQIKPYGSNIKFSLKFFDKSNSSIDFTNTTTKVLHTEGSFGDSSREINIVLRAQDNKILPAADFGLFSAGSTDLLAK